MSSTSDRVGVMSPEQERLLYSIVQQLSETSQKVDNLHSTLYENGFLDRMKKIERWIDTAQEEHIAMCPVGPRLDRHIAQIESEKKEKKEQRFRKMDWRFTVAAVVVAFIASVPSWITLVVGGIK